MKNMRSHFGHLVSFINSIRTEGAILPNVFQVQRSHFFKQTTIGVIFGGAKLSNA
jgi:hypothetical protein